MLRQWQGSLLGIHNLACQGKKWHGRLKNVNPQPLIFSSQFISADSKVSTVTWKMKVIFFPLIFFSLIFFEVALFFCEETYAFVGQLDTSLWDKRSFTWDKEKSLHLPLLSVPSCTLTGHTGANMFKHKGVNITVNRGGGKSHLLSSPHPSQKSKAYSIYWKKQNQIPTRS